MKIILSGGSGLVGSALAYSLHQKGHEVGILTRKIKRDIPYQQYLWNADSIDPKALENVDAIFHLAGENIFAQRWTPQRKKELIASRVNTLQLISQQVRNSPILISASAIGYYGANTHEELLNESSPQGDDFLAECCRLWEQEVEHFKQKHHSRTCIFRNGLVLSNQGGVLPIQATTVRYGLGSYLGTGTQWMSWICIDDLVNHYLMALENATMNGMYNAVSTSPIRHADYMESLARVFNRKIILPRIPEWTLKLALGERYKMVCGSSKVISNKSLPLKWVDLEKTIKHLYSKKASN